MTDTLVEPAELQITWSVSGVRPQAAGKVHDSIVQAQVGHRQRVATSGSMVASPDAYRLLPSSHTTSHGGGVVLWPGSLPFEDSLRWRESAQRLQRLWAAKVSGMEPVLPHPVADSLDASIASRALDYLKAQPKCPLLALVFAVMVKPLGPVERVICQGENDELKIWTVVNRATHIQRYAIYDRQWDVMQIFRGSVVEFNLVDRDDRPLERLMEWSGRAFVIEG